MSKVLRVSRSQLADFIKDHQTLREFERLFDSDNALVILVNNVISGTGLGSDGKYTPRTDSNYLNSSTDMYSDSTLLDIALFNYTREYVNSITTTTALSAMAQTVLCDTTTGNINVTLPPPASCFSSERSFRIAVHKIDDTVNTVTILPNSGELIVGDSSQLLKRRGDVLNFITDGTNWYLGS